MAIFQRYLQNQVKKDLKRKMVFIGGPRQVGKTTLAQTILGHNKEGYLNWDIPEHRERILKRKWPLADLFIFDEIHKYRSWRNLLKGIYDEYRKKIQILVTGSAHLDFYRFGGDSLQGRYHYLRLHPLSAAELRIKTPEEMRRLLELGGFPEPFFTGSQEESKRWSREYRTRLIAEDVKSLENVQDIGNFEMLIIRLPDLVGSPLSINALREDLNVSHKTVTKWLNILERLYAIFRIPPFGAPKIRAVKKEQKHYHFDWSLIENQAIRFENMIGCHLLKWVHYNQDVRGEDIELRYLRDIDGREIDFVVTKKKEPIIAVEVKWKNTEIPIAMKYFKKRFPSCEMWLIDAEGNENYRSTDGIRVTNAINFLKKLI